jgi:hypothetical protein
MAKMQKLGLSRERAEQRAGQSDSNTKALPSSLSIVV